MSSFTCHSHHTTKIIELITRHNGPGGLTSDPAAWRKLASIVNRGFEGADCGVLGELLAGGLFEILLDILCDHEIPRQEIQTHASVTNNFVGVLPRGDELWVLPCDQRGDKDPMPIGLVWVCAHRVLDMIVECLRNNGRQNRYYEGFGSPVKAISQRYTFLYQRAAMERLHTLRTHRIFNYNDVEVETLQVLLSVAYIVGTTADAHPAQRAAPKASFDQYLECLAVFTSVLALADCRPELYSYHLKSMTFQGDIMQQMLSVLHEHLDKLRNYKGQEITLHGSKSTSARLAHLVGMTEEEFANMLVRTMKVQRDPMRFGAMVVFSSFKMNGLNMAGSAAIRNAAEYTPSLAWVKSLRVETRKGLCVDSEQTLYETQILSVMMWHTTLNHMAYEPHHAAQAMRDKMIVWLGEFSHSRLVDKKAVDSIVGILAALLNAALDGGEKTYIEFTDQLAQVIAPLHDRWHRLPDHGASTVAAQIWPEIYFHAVEKRRLRVLCGSGNCKNEAAMRCGRCNVTRYCSVKCQKLHWKSHKKWCHTKTNPETTQ